MKIAIIAGGFTPPKRINYAALWPLSAIQERSILSRKN